MIRHLDLIDVVFFASVALAALGCLGLFVLLLRGGGLRVYAEPIERHTPEPRTVRTVRALRPGPGGLMGAEPQVSTGSTPFQGEVPASGPSRERLNGPVAALTFDRVIAVNVARAKRWHAGFPRDHGWTGADWSNAMCGEAGEVANVVKKLRRHECGLRGALDPPSAELLTLLGDELADTILYLILLAAKYGVDLPAAVVRKFNVVSERQGFPERLP